VGSEGHTDSHPGKVYVYSSMQLSKTCQVFLKRHCIEYLSGPTAPSKDLYRAPTELVQQSAYKESSHRCKGVTNHIFYNIGNISRLCHRVIFLFK
jgi:hypothetical protein